jgi:hypothetical protein
MCSHGIGKQLSFSKTGQNNDKVLLNSQSDLASQARAVYVFGKMGSALAQGEWKLNSTLGSLQCLADNMLSVHDIQYLCWCRAKWPELRSVFLASKIELTLTSLNHCAVSNRSTSRVHCVRTGNNWLLAMS